MRGNNSDIIKRVLEGRKANWVEVSSTNTLFNFKWAPLSKGLRFDQLTTHGQKQLVNHFERHSEISQKDKLFMNMQKYCEAQKLNVFDFLPVTFVVSYENGQYKGLDRFKFLHSLLEKHHSLSSSQKKINGYPLTLNQKIISYKQYSMNESMFSGNNSWLIKPPVSERGRGI